MPLEMNTFSHPTLLIDSQVCRNNIQKMSGKALGAGCRFRPHFKTHQSAAIGDWFREAGVDSITVSSVSMGQYFAAHGWKDITIAFPLNIREIDEINALAGSIRLNLLIEAVETAEFLTAHLRSPAGVFIKIDTGYHRSGIDPENTHLIDTILHALSSSNLLTFLGFLTHTGQTYHARSREEIVRIANGAKSQLQQLKSTYRERYPKTIISFGDTPSCSLLEDLSGLDELRPGNFVFYDLMQYFLGSCQLADIAAALISPVVAVHPERAEAVLYGGAVHFSKESITGPQGETVFGLAVAFEEGRWELHRQQGYLVSLSQEHGILKMNQGVSLKPGELIAVFPVHSCLVMDLMMGKGWVSFR